MNLLRAFIAIEIPAEIKQAIAVQTLNLRKAAGSALRWVTPENTHLTLKFLGDLSSDKVVSLSKALQAECSLAESFQVTVGGIGCFPNLNRPRVLWVGLNAPEALRLLQQKVEETAKGLSASLEGKPFSAHLTIARVRERASLDEVKQLQAAMDELKIGELGSFSVNSITLFKSELRPSGPLYTALSTAQLGN